MGCRRFAPFVQDVEHGGTVNLAEVPYLDEIVQADRRFPPKAGHAVSPACMAHKARSFGKRDGSLLVEPMEVLLFGAKPHDHLVHGGKSPAVVVVISEDKIDRNGDPVGKKGQMLPQPSGARNVTRKQDGPRRRQADLRQKTVHFCGLQEFKVQVAQPDDGCRARGHGLLFPFRTRFFV